MTLKSHYALCFKKHASFGAHHENFNKDRSDHLTPKYMTLNVHFTFNFQFSLLEIFIHRNNGSKTVNKKRKKRKCETDLTNYYDPRFSD